MTTNETTARAAREAAETAADLALAIRRLASTITAGATADGASAVQETDGGASAAQQQIAAEAATARVAVDALREIGILAEYVNIGGGTMCIEVALPGGWVATIGTSNGEGWGWSVNDERGNTGRDVTIAGRDGAEISGARFRHTRTEQAAAIVRAVRAMVADRAVNLAAVRALVAVGDTMAEVYPGHPGDVPPGWGDGVTVQARSAALAWGRANVPDFNL